jgi:hypothetical protein
VFFVLSKTVGLLADPVAVATVMIAAAALLALLRRRRTLRQVLALLETASNNTHDNATNCAVLLHDVDGSAAGVLTGATSCRSSRRSSTAASRFASMRVSSPIDWLDTTKG